MMHLDDIEKAVRKEVSLETQVQLVKKQLEDAQAELELAEKQAFLYKNCAELLVKTSLAIQEKTTQKIAKIVTDMYQYVFLTEDRFVIQVDTKRSVPVANFFIETKKQGKPLLLNPLKSDGGGKVDVIALGLRLAALLLYKPSLNKVLFLDEPMRFLSTTATSSMPYRLRAAEFLKQIAKEYGIQLIVVTHDTELADMADNTYEIHLADTGYAEIEHIKK